MPTERYEGIINGFHLTTNELRIMLFNFYDAVAFNEYLQNDSKYLKTDFNSEELIRKLQKYFDNQNIDEETRKKIVISAPLIFSCDNFEEQLDIIYKDEEIEGIIVTDKNQKKHPYRITNNLRCITENKSLLTNLQIDAPKNYKKTYYTKKNRT